MSNPFNISFGEEPINMISRENELKDIISTFESEQPETKTYIITGPRGSGKTVVLSKVKEYFEKTKNWLTIDLNPYIDFYIGLFPIVVYKSIYELSLYDVFV